MLYHLGFYAFSNLELARAIAFALVQGAGMAIVGSALERFSNDRARQRHPFHDPAVIVAATVIFLAIAGMILSIGGAWTLAIEGPTFLFSLVTRVRQYRQG